MLVDDLNFIKKAKKGANSYKWKKPSKGWLKLNVDGSVFARVNRGAAGGLLRDEEGVWQWGFVADIQCPTVLESEIEAIRIGLSIAWERRVQKIEVESDSKEAISLVMDQQILNHPLQQKIEECRELLHKPWDTKVRWIARSGNMVADAIAKLPHLRDGEISFLLIAPPSIMSHVMSDIA